MTILNFQTEKQENNFKQKKEAVLKPLWEIIKLTRRIFRLIVVFYFFSTHFFVLNVQYLPQLNRQLPWVYHQCIVEL